MAESGSNETYESRLFEIAEQLQIPDSTLQITRVRLDRLSGEDDIDETQMDTIAPAVLALSCREDGLPLSDEEIVGEWLSLLGVEGEDAPVQAEHLPEQIQAVADRLDIDHPPARPDELIDKYADMLDLDARLVTVAHRILRDTFEHSPRAVAEASSPSETAGAALVVAAEVNGVEGYGPSDVAEVGAAGGVTIKNRYKAFHEALGDDALSSERYRADAAADEATDAAGDANAQETTTETEASTDGADGQADAPGASEEQAAAEADGNGTAPDETETEVSPAACMDVVRDLYPDELPTTATVAEALEAPEDEVGATLEALAGDGELQAKRAGETVAWIPGESGELDEELTVDALGNEVDALADALDVDASLRLFARGLVSDAAGDVPVEDAAEFAGAALIAASRMNDGDLDPATVAAEREFAPRALYDWLDRLGEVADVDIPTRGPTDIVESLAADLELSETVREESLRTLEQYRPEADGSFAAPELAAGAVFFAATTVREPIDVDELAESIGFETSHVSDAMNSVFVSLCRGLIRGEIDYDDCSWTDELLESDHIAEIGDPHTGRVVAAAKTYIAGREAEHVDEGTLDVLLSED